MVCKLLDSAYCPAAAINAPCNHAEDHPPLYREVIAGETAHYGESNVETLGTKGNLANLLKDKRTPESLEQVEALYREVLAGRTAHYGESNVETLVTKGNLAVLLKNKRTPESLEQAEAL
jgi:stalled ribosome rescue protein Dom34